MDDAEKLLRNWKQSLPRDGAKEEEAKKVMEFLGITVVMNNLGHLEASHEALKGHPKYPFGRFTVNCHARGKQGQAHPKGIHDIVSAAKIIQAAQQKESQDDEDDTDGADKNPSE